MHGMIVIMMLIGVAAVVFWVWTLIDCLTNKQLTETQKAIWAVVILLTGWIGSLIYFFAGRTQKVYAPAPHYYPPQEYRQPRSEQFSQENYQSYQAGYRVQNYAQPERSNMGTPAMGEEQSAQQQQQAQYEEIQISYPEQSTTD